MTLYLSDNYLNKNSFVVDNSKAQHEDYAIDGDDLHAEPTFDQRPVKNEVHNKTHDKSMHNKTEGHTEFANDYVHGMLDKLMGENSHQAQDQEGEGEEEESEDEADYKYDKANVNKSIERRISDVEDTPRSEQNHNHSRSVLENESNTSTVKNMANEYVSNMIKGHYQ